MIPDCVDTARRLVVSIGCLTACAMPGCDRTEVGAGRTGMPPERVRVENFALLDHLGRFHELYYYSDARAIVLFVQGNDCLIVRDTLPAFRRAAERFEEQEVVFLMINANLQDDRESIAREARDYDIDFPVLVDETQLIAESLDLSRTAEALVIDPLSWQVVYRGPTDDRRGYGTRHEAASRHYLEEALEALLARETVDLDAPLTQGCLITRSGPEGKTHESISYADDIVPILQARCEFCHHDGGIAPWAMDSYEAVRGWSAMMREVILTKRMPPWHADPHIGRFANDRSLSVEEETALTRWIAAGAPRGVGADPLKEAAPAREAEWPLGPPDLVLDVEPQEIPAIGVIPYQYITLENPLEEDVWVRAAHFRPSNPKVLHHALVFVRSPRDAGSSAGGSSAQAADPPRRSARGSPGVPFHREIFTKYNPGVVGDVFPSGTARLLPVGSRIRVQLHYTPTGRAETDAPRLALYVSKRPPEHELKITAAFNRRFKIPPYTKQHEVHAQHRFERDVVIYSMQPHMHYRGREMSFEALFPDGTRELLLSVPNYDFNFQSFYDLEEPRHLPAGTRIRCRAVFDNSTQNEANPDPSRRVGWGVQSTDEMLIGYLVYTESDAPRTVASTSR